MIPLSALLLSILPSLIVPLLMSSSSMLPLLNVPFPTKPFHTFAWLCEPAVTTFESESVLPPAPVFSFFTIALLFCTTSARRFWSSLPKRLTTSGRGQRVFRLPSAFGVPSSPEPLPPDVETRSCDRSDVPLRSRARYCPRARSCRAPFSGALTSFPFGPSVTMAGVSVLSDR
ncbi:hypothetical protein AGLY_013791 [Aphis glycines]|uniref:Secreted protein n=1 Tax=Aphis glycines TaxID=307491 RepID=A0A6G0T5F9_APHGL|nr:hypothetical protein AGLY_013791 [Aphis glycines]